MCSTSKESCDLKFKRDFHFRAARVSFYVLYYLCKEFENVKYFSWARRHNLRIIGFAILGYNTLPLIQKLIHVQVRTPAIFGFPISSFDE